MLPRRILRWLLILIPIACSGACEYDEVCCLAQSDSSSSASSTNLINNPPITPEDQALGNGSATPNGGVNQQLVPFLENFRGKRIGIVMFDFYETPSDLLPLFLSLLPPSKEASYGA